SSDVCSSDLVRDLLAGTVRLTRRLHPDVGVDTRSRVGARTLAETSAGLVAPVALVDPAVDPRLVDPGLQVSRVARAGGPVRATPTVTRGVDQHADVLAEASLDQPLTERLSEAQLVVVTVPVDPARLPGLVVDLDVRLLQRRVVG